MTLNEIHNQRVIDFVIHRNVLEAVLVCFDAVRHSQHLFCHLMSRRFPVLLGMK